MKLLIRKTSAVGISLVKCPVTIRIAAKDEERMKKTNFTAANTSAFIVDNPIASSLNALEDALLNQIIFQFVRTFDKVLLRASKFCALSSQTW